MERKKLAKGWADALTLHPLKGFAVALEHGLDGEAGVVGLGTAAVGRTKAQAVGIEARAETEIEPGTQELLSQLWFAAEGMDDARHTGRGAAEGLEQFVPGPDAMNDERLLQLAGQGDVTGKTVLLRFQSNGTEFVEPALADGHDFRPLRQRLNRMEGLLPVARIHRMNAHGIESPFAKRKRYSRQHGIGQVDDGLPCGCVKTVGMDVGYVLQHKRVPALRHGIVTAAAPGMATEDAAQGEPEAAKRSVLADGFDGIL